MYSLTAKAKKSDGYLTGKRSEFIIVEFKDNEYLIGQFVDVKITEAMNWEVKGVINA